MHDTLSLSCFVNSSLLLPPLHRLGNEPRGRLQLVCVTQLVSGMLNFDSKSALISPPIG